MRGLIRLREMSRARGAVPVTLARAIVPRWCLEGWAERGLVVISCGYVSLTEAGVVAADTGSAAQGDVVRRLLSADRDAVPSRDDPRWLRGLPGPHWGP